MGLPVLLKLKINILENYLIAQFDVVPSAFILFMVIYFTSFDCLKLTAHWTVI